MSENKAGQMRMRTRAQLLDELEDHAHTEAMAAQAVRRDVPGDTTKAGSAARPVGELGAPEREGGAAADEAQASHAPRSRDERLTPPSDADLWLLLGEVELNHAGLTDAEVRWMRGITMRLMALKARPKAWTKQSNVTPEDTMLFSHCPSCDSPEPHRHPAVQLGGEVQLCSSEWHRSTPEGVYAIEQSGCGTAASVHPLAAGRDPLDERFERAASGEAPKLRTEQEWQAWYWDDPDRGPNELIHTMLAERDAALAAHRSGAKSEHQTIDRDILGQEVRAEWVAWAREQPNPKAAWLEDWNQLDDADREVDRRIGERLFRMGVDSVSSGAQIPWCPNCGSWNIDEDGCCETCGATTGHVPPVASQETVDEVLRGLEAGKEQKELGILKDGKE